MEDILLSICIPTYNKSQYLQELIVPILNTSHKNIEIVVTDILSTDDTVEMLQSMNDSRIRICKNSIKKPPYQYLLESLFAGQGKYTIHCNDRDLINTDSLGNLLLLLKNNDYSFVYTTSKGVNSGKLRVFDNNYESLLHQRFTHHPTGMIFNSHLMHQYLRVENYYKYLDRIFVWDFVMRDLFPYGKSAIFDIGVWSERPQEFKVGHKSGVLKGNDAYFLPHQMSKVMEATTLHALNPQRLSPGERLEVGFYLLRFFLDLLSIYKSCMFSPYETAHYGLERKFITTYEMMQIFNMYYKKWLNFMQGYDHLNELSEWWKSSYWKSYIWFLWKCGGYINASFVKNYLLHWK